MVCIFLCESWLGKERTFTCKMAGERRAPLASIDDFSSICYYSPSRNKKLPDFSMPLLRESKGDGNGGMMVDGGIEMVENTENVENIAKYNVNKKLRPLVKVPLDR